MTDGVWEAYNARIEELREREYPMLKDEIYLDHAGTTLYAKSLIEKFSADMVSNLYGNPHSGSASSQASTSRIDDVRLRLLQFFNADPAEFDLVFVANATAGIKLVVEALRAGPDGFTYVYHQSSHTSLVGVREETRTSLCFDDVAVENWIAGTHVPDELKGSTSPILFAYPAQSNMDGSRMPLDWSRRLRKRGCECKSARYTLLDAAAYVATSQLDLSDSDCAPDFTVLSLYKIFGFPDLGALIVRRQAVPVFRHRKYFGGGTVDMVVCRKEKWHASKVSSLHEALEDGTLPTHSIIALDAALETHQRLFGKMESIALHTSVLAHRLHNQLAALRHGNGAPVCAIYSPSSKDGRKLPGTGPVVAFNLRNSYGAWISLAEFEKLATLKKFHIRTGGLCNPGGISTALGLEPWEMKRNFSSGFRCGNENDIICGKPTGIVRVSLGAMSTVADVDKFVLFISEFYLDQHVSELPVSSRALESGSEYNLQVRDIMVYPIKSCAGFRVPRGVLWDMRPEGLAWDREWCLVHRGTGRALSQKQHPRMALLQPLLDFDKGVLQVSYRGLLPDGKPPSSIAIPLSADPSVFESPQVTEHLPSRVCGEAITAQKYGCPDINGFFSSILGVSCALARFPPGGQGKSMRHAKAHLQKHQNVSSKSSRYPLPSGMPGVTTPPDSDTETEQRRILLSNESPILAINLSSLAVLNREVMARGGKPVSADVFRANIVIGPPVDDSRQPSAEDETLAYSEDHWSTLRIGQQDFQMLGSCRRCHMVCIDQDTAIKSEEPFVTLTKTRRFDGKVFFGTHMCHIPATTEASTVEAQRPTIQIGDTVMIDV
ncbi:Molybdenum cofactor sulfurase [Pestalotiopsis fici W106-1]|uniref:Molybdenum cofactor sulfurase n=1 Tax=Pestalotiopsis fici (strain W106-1 / CGMCC3.15140) TaxID=1229662 RepID=W3XMU1_PESFW|nr:Molybdenum cofactor sulfurase [Pestalotiopsis fici W106-1]ETS87363.1 Molybdenum cofactor sulfurase [Pestalotiopsis fici W106-1]